MRPAVDARFHQFSTPFEGRVYHMYRDKDGWVTTGVGNLLKTPAAAAGRPFRHGGAGGPAPAGDIEDGWAKVHACPPNLWVSKTGNDAYGRATDLRLTDEDVDQFVLESRTLFDNDLNSRYKTTGNPSSYRDYSDFCADAQLGLLSMCWPGGFNSFLEFHKAVQFGEWFRAALNSHIKDDKNPGLVPRNAANKWLFCVAGRVELFQADPAVHHYAKTDPQGINKLFILKGGQCVRYDWDTESVDSGLLGNHFQLPSPFDSGVDAAFNGYGTLKNPVMLASTFFLRGNQYVRYHWDQRTADLAAHPLSDWGLPGDFAQGVDAAFNGYDEYRGKLYFFKGDQYVRYDWARRKVDAGPKPIGEAWCLPPPFDQGVDAVVSGEGPYLGKLYFFKGTQYVRFKWKPTYQQDGEIKEIGPHWTGLSGVGMTSGLSCLVNPPGRS